MNEQVTETVESIKRERKVKLSPTGLTVENTDGTVVKLSAEKRLENRQKNVSFYAATRVNKAAKSIEVFGNCYGSKYEWTQEQIDKTEKFLNETVKRAIKNITDGVEIVAAGITL